MDEDTEQAALAHQQELEARHYNEILASDPGYHEWIERTTQEYEDEVFSKGFQGF